MRSRIARLALTALVLFLFRAGTPVPAAPGYWVDNEWIRVVAEAPRRAGDRTVLVLIAECKQQGLPEYIVTYLDAQGAPTGEAKSGKYCPGPGDQIEFVLPLPESGTWRIEFNRAQGAM
jgi:hypothetical protein